MADRAMLLSIIERAYEARCNGDKAGVDAFLAPNATFSLNGESNALAGVPQGTSKAHAAIGDLIDQFTFHSIVRLDAVIEDKRVALRSRAVVSTGGGDPVTTELFDLWTFDEALKVTSIVQFADTALILKMAGG